MENAYYASLSMYAKVRNNYRNSGELSIGKKNRKD